MQVSAPIYVLKRKARRMSRDTGTALHHALDSVATEEGFQSWSHLVGSSARDSPAKRLLAQLTPGDLALIAARPGQGKTLLGLELAANASDQARKATFFSLDYTERDVAEQLAGLGLVPSACSTSLIVDTSDDISADYIIRKVAADPAPALIVVDYLQLLDQKRSTPTLDDQIRALRTYVRDAGALCVVLSQIDRSFDLAEKPMPDRSDIRLPNPLDLAYFSKLFFLHNGRLRLDPAS